MKFILFYLVVFSGTLSSAFFTNDKDINPNYFYGKQSLKTQPIIKSNSIIDAFTEWNSKTPIPGNLDLAHPEKNTKVYLELFRFLYGGLDLKANEIEAIPKVIQSRLAEDEKKLLGSKPKEHCETTHKVEFHNSKTGLGISNSQAMLGFESGLVHVETTACLNGDTSQALELIASDTIWNPEFRLKALKFAENVWISPFDKNQLCEKLNFSVAFYDVGTSNYCMESQNLKIPEANTLFMNIRLISNKSRAEGVSLPIFFNQQLISLRKTPSGLFFHFNSYIRGFGAAGAPRDSLIKILVEQQNSFIEELQNQIR